jgi:hypothetical protein
MAKVGRPSKYTKELAEEICNAIATSGKGLISLCNEHDNWPDRANIFRWINTNLEFRAMYALAKEHQVEVNVDYLQEIMNEPHRYINERGIEVCDASMLRTKVDAIKWHAAKLKAKKYGVTADESTDNNLLDKQRKHYADLDAKNKKEY